MCEYTEEIYNSMNLTKIITDTNRQLHHAKKCKFILCVKFLKSIVFSDNNNLIFPRKSYVTLHRKILH